jgi:hypothetical protein
VRGPLAAVAPTPAEIAAALPGDDIVADADVVMDRAFTVSVPPDVAWPWLAQLGKRRAGWYLPRSVERFIPLSRRGLRWTDPAFPALQVGDVIPDWGGRDASFEVALIDPPKAVVYRSRRGRMSLSWTIVLRPVAVTGPSFGPEATRVQLRLRLGPVRRVWLANSVGDLIDGLTIVGLAAGLRERVRGQ